MVRHIADIETLAGLFTITLLDYDSDKHWVYIISKDHSDFQKIKDHLFQVDYLIGFNSIDFDSNILHWMIDQNNPTVEEIYKAAQAVINKHERWDDYQPYSKYKYKTPWINIDLFLYWSKMLRLSKKLSLKYFAVNLDMKIQEMPISHTQSEFTEEEIKEVCEYNLNDDYVTKSLAIKLKEQINLRVAIQKQYKLDAISWDAPKIASELLLDSYCKKTFKTSGYYNELEFWEYKKLIRNDTRSKKDFLNGDYLPNINFKTQIFKDLYRDIYNSINGFSRDVLFKRFDSTYIKISYGSGGIHSVNKNEYYKSTDKLEVWTSDVKSLYPTLLINYGFIRKDLREILEIYTQTRDQRLEAKKKKDKVKDETYKLILNSTTGLLDNEYSWLYSPAEVMALRLTGQLILTRLFEECNLAGFLVVSLNTDGIEVIIPTERRQEYLDIINLIEQEFDLEFEHKKYKSIHYKTVNDYIAVTSDDEIKVKGEFIYEKVLDGSNEFLIIPIAIKEYLVNNIPIEQTILNHTNIYDFCCSKKINKDYTIWYNGSKQQQLNRFYLSKKGAYLYKQKNTKNTMESIFKDSSVIIVNDVVNEFPKDIDFQYYINRAKETIQLFEKPQLQLF